MLAKMQRNQITHTWLEESKMEQWLWKTVWPFLRPLNMWLSYNQQLHSWVFLSQRHENWCSHKHLHTNVHSSHWKQSPRPCTSEWWNTLWYIHTMGSCSAMNTNPWYTQLGWICRELCYMNKADPKRLHMYDSMYVAPLKDKVIEMENRLMVARGWWLGEEGYGYRRAAEEVLVVLELSYILTVGMTMWILYYCFAR